MNSTIMLSPLYSTFIVNKQYFNNETTEPEFIIFNLNSHESRDSTTVMKNVKLFDNKLNNDIISNGQSKLSFSYKHLLYYQKNNMFCWYVRDKKKLTTYYRYEFNSRDFQELLYKLNIFSQKYGDVLVVHDIENRKKYILINYPNYFIDIEDININNFKIYVFENGFIQYSTTEDLNKFCLNPFLKLLNFNIEMPDESKMKNIVEKKITYLQSAFLKPRPMIPTPSKMDGGLLMILLKKIILIMLFVIVISVIVVCICIYYKIPNNIIKCD